MFADISQYRVDQITRVRDVRMLPKFPNVSIPASRFASRFARFEYLPSSLGCGVGLGGSGCVNVGCVNVGWGAGVCGMAAWGCGDGMAGIAVCCGAMGAKGLLDR